MVDLVCGVETGFLGHLSSRLVAEAPRRLKNCQICVCVFKTDRLGETDRRSLYSASFQRCVSGCGCNATLVYFIVFVSRFEQAKMQSSPGELRETRDWDASRNEMNHATRHSADSFISSLEVSYMGGVRCPAQGHCGYQVCSITKLQPHIADGHSLIAMVT